MSSDRSWIKLCLYTFFAIAIFNCFAAVADVQPANSDQYPHISALENAILGQNFPFQTLNDRLARMEKKAFGSASSNDDLSARTDNLDDYVDKTLHKKLLQANVDDDTTDSTGNTSIQNQSQYPHVDDLEKVILGRIFTADAITDRLVRMENKAFSSASNDPDLSARIDALDAYVAKSFHRSLVRTDDNVSEASVAAQTDYPHVTDLEQIILGQTYAAEALPDRLGRMETKVFGKISESSDLSERTDALESYAEKKLHKKVAKAPTDDTAQSSSMGTGLLNKVGNALLGMAVGSGSGMGGLGGMGSPMGFNGLGSGLGGNRFGGINMQRRQAEDPPPQKPAARPEDPAVYEKEPPNSSAKLIVKVGWCEVNVFGHTFPTMHLPERLGQLNNELHLESGKTDVQLMDDIGLMIKTVQARKLSPKAVGN
jgi:hypothetical protein